MTQNKTSKETTIPVTTCDTALIALKTIRGTSSLSWRAIAALPQYRPIPAGTLCRWYKTGYLPPKWFRRLGIIPRERVVVSRPSRRMVNNPTVEDLAAAYRNVIERYQHAQKEKA